MCVKLRADGMGDNHCTASPDGTWGTCCKRHDKRYENKRLTRYQADKLLYRCIKRYSNAIIGSIYWLGVRLFGWYFYNNTKKGDG